MGHMQHPQGGQLNQQVPGGLEMGGHGEGVTKLVYMVQSVSSLVPNEREFDAECKLWNNFCDLSFQFQVTDLKVGQ